MILFKIQAGLGNQLFQWAYSFCLSKQHNVSYDINFYKYQHLNQDVTVRDFELYKLLDEPIKLIDGPGYNKFNSQDIIKIQDDFTFKKHALREGSHYYFDGYWQDERYFINHSNEIKNLIKLPDTDAYDFNNSCSLHVRRGDYIKNQSLHPIQPISYYQNAIDIIKPKGKVYIFSDDIDWCKKNLKVENSVFISNNTNIMDLSIMSKCTNNICANSSFSWWAAWLNKNPNKKIICPKIWTGDSGPKDYSIAPKEWIKI